MRRRTRVAMLVTFLAVMPVLAGCENFDPDSLDVFGMNAKKKLPGKREALFPNGVPGVTQGIPPEYMKGYKPETAALTSGDAETTTAAATPVAGERKTAVAAVHEAHEAKVSKREHKATSHRRIVHRKPKAEPRIAVKPKSTPQPAEQTASQPQPGQGTSAPWPSSAPQQTQAGWPAPQQSQAGWPTAQGDQGSQKLAPWPSAPPPGSFSK